MFEQLKENKENRLSDEVARQLRQLIQDGHIRPGERIIESELAQVLGLSKSPIREGLAQLIQEGLLFKSPRRGVYVREFEEKDFWEIQTLRISLEGLAISLGIANYTPPWVQNLEELITAIKYAANKQEMDLAHLNFHEVLCSNTQHTRLSEMLRGLRILLRTYLPFLNLLSGDSYTVAAEHIRILESIKEKNAFAAQKALEEHIVQDFDKLKKIF